MEKELPIDLSNVQIVCKTCGRPTRVGHRTDEEGKVRVCRRCGADL
jgi:large subunit ribosomal protein L24